MTSPRWASNSYVVLSPGPVVREVGLPALASAQHWIGRNVRLRNSRWRHQRSDPVWRCWRRQHLSMDPQVGSRPFAWFQAWAVLIFMQLKGYFDVLDLELRVPLAHAETPSRTSPSSSAPAAFIFVVLAIAVFVSLSCIAAQRVAIRSSFRRPLTWTIRAPCGFAMRAEPDDILVSRGEGYITLWQ
jgi:hypothetical protein